MQSARLQTTKLGLKYKRSNDSWSSSTMDEVSNPEDSGFSQELSQQIIALAALVPGLKKTEETSVLSGYIEYIKKLQEREKTLEEQAAKKNMGELSSQSSHVPLLDIKAKISDTSVLIRILCENKKGVVTKVVAEIEKLNLTVIHSSIMPFGTSTLDMTVVAQMEEEFDMACEDIVENMHSSCHRFI